MLVSILLKEVLESVVQIAVLPSDRQNFDQSIHLVTPVELNRYRHARITCSAEDKQSPHGNQIAELDLHGEFALLSVCFDDLMNAFDFIQHVVIVALRTMQRQRRTRAE